MRMKLAQNLGFEKKGYAKSGRFREKILCFMGKWFELS